MAGSTAPARPPGSLLRRLTGRRCLLGGAGVALGLGDTRGKVCGRDDLQHLEVFRAGDLAVLDAGRLQDRIALADGVATLALVLERRPAIHDEHELERAVMHVPFLHLVLHLLAVVTDEVGNEIALGAVLNAEIAVFEDLAPAGCPFGLTGEVVHEFPGLVGHRFPPSGDDRYMLTPLSTDLSRCDRSLIAGQVEAILAMWIGWPSPRRWLEASLPMSASG